MDIQTIKKRRDFLKGNNAPYAAMPSVVVQSYMRTDEVVETDESVMMGITCSKKVFFRHFLGGRKFRACLRPALDRPNSGAHQDQHPGVVSYLKRVPKWT